MVVAAAHIAAAHPPRLLAPMWHVQRFPPDFKSETRGGKNVWKSEDGETVIEEGTHVRIKIVSATLDSAQLVSRRPCCRCPHAARGPALVHCARATGFSVVGPVLLLASLLWPASTRTISA